MAGTATTRGPGRPKGSKTVPAAHPPEIREAAVERMRAGEPFASVAADLNVSAATLRGWQRKDNAEPKGVPPPAGPKTGAGTKYRSAPGRRPITEQTAGMLVAGIFTLIAIFDDPVWALTAQERDALASPMADSMRTLPTPVADAINTYSAPATFFSALVTIVSVKMRQKREKNEAAAKQPLRPVPPPPAGQNPNGAQIRPPWNPPRDGPVYPQPAPTPAAPRVDASLADALAAARGSLSQLDAQDEAEAMLS